MALSLLCSKPSWSTSDTKAPATRQPTGLTSGALQAGARSPQVTKASSQPKTSGFIRCAKTTPQFSANSKMGSPNIYIKVKSLRVRSLISLEVGLAEVAELSNPGGHAFAPSAKQQPNVQHLGANSMVTSTFCAIKRGAGWAQRGQRKQNAHCQWAFCLRGKPRIYWLREKDLNLRPLGYEPNELPDCSIARYLHIVTYTATAASATASADDTRSTNSTKAIGALSPTRKPIFKMRV